MTPLPFALPAVSSLEALSARRDLALFQVYDGASVAFARARTVAHREAQPDVPVCIVAELERSGLTHDGWRADALAALFEGVGASCIVFAQPNDPDGLTATLGELLPQARITLGACIPGGLERALLPQLSAAPLLLSPDAESEKALQNAACDAGWFDALPPYHEPSLTRQLIAVTCGEAFYIDATLDIAAECDISDEDVVFERWLLDREDEWGAVRVLVGDEDDVAIFDQSQYMLRVPLVISAADEALYEQMLRRFCGIAVFDGTSELSEEALERFTRRYGLIVL